MSHKKIFPSLLQTIVNEWDLSAEESTGLIEPLMGNLFQIAVDLDALYRDIEVIQKFLRQPQETLDNKTPLEMMSNGNIIRVREYVAYLSGRY